jgi:hypothetical protein
MALLKGARLSEATVHAREAARSAGDATWLAYTVYGTPNARLSCILGEYRASNGYKNTNHHKKCSSDTFFIDTVERNRQNSGT